MAELPRQIIAAGPWLASLAEGVPRQLGTKRALITYPMRDPAFPAATVLPRLRSTFANVGVAELAQAKHFFLEDAPGDVARAVTARFA